MTMTARTRLQQFQRDRAEAYAIFERHLTQRDIGVFVDVYRLFIAHLKNLRYFGTTERTTFKMDIAVTLYLILRPIAINAANHALRAGCPADAYRVAQFVDTNDRYVSVTQAERLHTSLDRLREIVGKQPDTYTYTDPTTRKPVRVKNHQLRADPLLI
jgi:hypothetical protein